MPLSPERRKKMLSSIYTLLKMNDQQILSEEKVWLSKLAVRLTLGANPEQEDITNLEKLVTRLASYLNP